MTVYQCQECGWSTGPGRGDDAAFEASRPDECPYCAGDLVEVLSA